MFTGSETLHDDVGCLPAQWMSGEQEALSSLVPLVYSELRRLAHHRLLRQAENHGVETSALVHAAYLRLALRGSLAISDRSHFFALPEGIMRQMPVDHAREKNATKPASGVKLELQRDMIPVSAPELDMLAPDAALTRLAKLDARQSYIVELRFLAGMPISNPHAPVIPNCAGRLNRSWRLPRAPVEQFRQP